MACTGGEPEPLVVRDNWAKGGIEGTHGSGGRGSKDQGNRVSAIHPDNPMDDKYTTFNEAQPMFLPVHPVMLKLRLFWA